MKELEWFISEYYTYSDIWIKNFIAMCGFIIIVRSLFLKEGIRRYTIYKLTKEAYLVIVIICLGKTISFFEIVQDKMLVTMNNINFNIKFFIVLMGLVIVYGLIQGIIYKKIRIPLLHILEKSKYVILIQVLWLSAIKHLEAIEGIAAIFAIALTELLGEFLNEETIVEEYLIESDYPDSNLYYTRKKQLENFLPILRQQKKEPYALMISGEWGSGKSSFIKALEKRESEDIFIWVETGSEKSVSEIMAEISEEIVDTLKNNNVLVEKEEVIESYFFAFSQILEETKLGIFNNLFNIL